jgi:hypothetical protein
MRPLGRKSLSSVLQLCEGNEQVLDILDKSFAGQIGSDQSPYQSDVFLPEYQKCTRPYLVPGTDNIPGAMPSKSPVTIIGF